MAEWLITATTDPLDDVDAKLITPFLSHLEKQADAGGLFSQPRDTFGMTKALVDYCIGAYDRIPESGRRGIDRTRSVRRIFSQFITEIVR